MNIDKNLAFDIGAFTGDTVPAIKSLGYTEIHCFEPEPINFSRLVKNYGKDTQVVCVQKALSNQITQLEMIVNSKRPFLNTLEKYWTENCRHTPHYPSDRLSKCIVDTVTLDSYINNIGRIPDFIKLDAEGHGVKILEKLSFKPNMLSFEWVSEFDQVSFNCLKFLNDLGFKEYKICYMENLPQKTDISYSYQECLDRLIEIKKKDRNNDQWGNIWCR